MTGILFLTLAHEYWLCSIFCILNPCSSFTISSTSASRLQWLGSFLCRRGNEYSLSLSEQAWEEFNHNCTFSKSLTLLKEKKKKKAREILIQRSRQITLINQKACAFLQMHAVHAAGSWDCTAVSVLPIQRGEASHMKIACGFRTGAILGLVTYSLFQIMNWIQFVPIYRERIKRCRVSRRINK